MTTAGVPHQCVKLSARNSRMCRACGRKGALAYASLKTAPPRGLARMLRFTASTLSTPIFRTEFLPPTGLPTFQKALAHRLDAGYQGNDIAGLNRRWFAGMLLRSLRRSTIAQRNSLTKREMLVVWELLDREVQTNITLTLDSHSHSHSRSLAFPSGQALRPQTLRAPTGDQNGGAAESASRSLAHVAKCAEAPKAKCC
jgi:hypothetical protein